MIIGLNQIDKEPRSMTPEQLERLRRPRRRFYEKERTAKEQIRRVLLNPFLRFGKIEDKGEQVSTEQQATMQECAECMEGRGESFNDESACQRCSGFLSTMDALESDEREQSQGLLLDRIHL